MSKKTRQRAGGQEHRLIRTLDNVRLFDELMPVIRACAIAQGGSEMILKKSEALAALQLIESLDSDKDDVRLKASVEILNRVSGKPVERTLNIYSDISKLNERDIDSQILRSIEKSGATKLIEAAISSRSIPKVKQSKKPKKSEFIEQITIEQPKPEGQA